VNKNIAIMRNQGLSKTIKFNIKDEIESEAPNETAMNAIKDETGMKVS